MRLHIAATVACLSTVAVTAQTGRIEIHAFDSVTVTDQQFLAAARDGKRVTIGAELRLPPGTGRVPTVILIHGSGGVGGTVDRWARELNSIGVGAFLVDSFTGRGIVSTSTDQSQLGALAMVLDAFRAKDLVAKHARVDVSRIALMGFSKGGDVALHAAMTRFQRLAGSTGPEFVAYVPFYAPCNTRYREDEVVRDRPIRMFHGAADNWVPVAACRDYVKLLKDRGRNIELTEYAGANHAFDNPLTPVQQDPQAQVRSRRCFLEEREGGVLVVKATGAPFTLSDPCVERGATWGYDAAATTAATAAVKAFFAALWKL